MRTNRPSCPCCTDGNEQSCAEKGTRFDVVGLGVSTMDLLQVVDRLPDAETVQRADLSAVCGGGPVATAVVAAARLGAKTAMLDRLGDDLLGRMIVEEFRAEGVDTGGIVVETGRSSSKASILVRKTDGARAITYSPGDAGELEAGHVDLALVCAARILHVNGRHWAASLYAARIAKAAGVLISFDGGAHRYDPRHRELIPMVDVCIVAEEYALSYSGAGCIDDAADALLQEGPELVVITRGMAGSSIFSREGDRFHQEAYLAGEVVDTTGAGDAYHGAFLFALARSWPGKEAARLASAVGALNTRALGGRAALPNLQQAEAFLRGE